MKRLAVLSVLVLTACASEPEMPVVTAQPGVAAEAPGGDWVVAQDYAAEAVGVVTSPYLGQTVSLDQIRVTDAAGRLCKAPAFRDSMAPASAALGNPAQPQAVQDSAARRVLTITCDGQPFSTLVAIPDGSWLTRVNSWVLKLERKAPKPAMVEHHPAAPPATVPTPAPVAAPTPAPMAAPVAAKTDKIDKRTLVYLASYKTEAAAKTGFKTLTKASPILAKQQPVTQRVDLGKKGIWVRLYGLAADEAERSKICGQLGKRVDECGARNRE